VRITNVIVAVIIFASTTAIAAPIECRTGKPSGAREYWAWRMIDGRQCWYAGERRMDKSKLRWGRGDGGMARVRADVDAPGDAVYAAASTKDQTRHQVEVAAQSPSEPAEPAAAAAIIPAPSAPTTFAVVEPEVEIVTGGFANFGLRQVTIIAALVFGSLLCFCAAAGLQRREQFD
jgi:hypothetical protein